MEPEPSTDLDPVIHAPTRLRIMAALGALQMGDALSFARLQQLLDLTAGNLVTHLHRLEEAGYVATAKSGRGRTARTSVTLTDTGRHALTTYRRAITDLLGG